MIRLFNHFLLHGPVHHTKIVFESMIMSIAPECQFIFKSMRHFMQAHIVSVRFAHIAFQYMVPGNINTLAVYMARPGSST